jgi:predicted alpha/beta hydrolase family esterase
MKNQTKILILHGWQGSPKSHWQSILYQDLKKDSFEVLFPTLPDKDNPTLDIWIQSLDNIMQTFKPDIIVCHSLANILWFHYLNMGKMKYTLKKLMLVSPVSPRCAIKEISTFFPYTVPLDLKASNKIMASSDNDPYITIDELYELSNKLEIGLKILENGKHINEKSGYGRLDCAYDWIV